MSAANHDDAENLLRAWQTESPSEEAQALAAETPCPTTAELQLAKQRKLPEPQHEALLSHVFACRSCGPAAIADLGDADQPKSSRGMRPLFLVAAMVALLIGIVVFWPDRQGPTADAPVELAWADQFGTILRTDQPNRLPSSRKLALRPSTSGTLALAARTAIGPWRILDLGADQQTLEVRGDEALLLPLHQELQRSVGGRIAVLFSEDPMTTEALANCIAQMNRDNMLPPEILQARIAW